MWGNIYARDGVGDVPNDGTFDVYAYNTGFQATTSAVIGNGNAYDQTNGYAWVLVPDPSAMSPARNRCHPRSRTRHGGPARLRPDRPVLHGETEKPQIVLLYADSKRDRPWPVPLFFSSAGNSAEPSDGGYL